MNAIFVRNGSRGYDRLCEGTSSLQRGVCTPGSALHFLVVPACVSWPTLMGANEGHVSINLGSVVYCQIEKVEQHKGTEFTIIVGSNNAYIFIPFFSDLPCIDSLFVGHEFFAKKDFIMGNCVYICRCYRSSNIFRCGTSQR